MPSTPTILSTGKALTINHNSLKYPKQDIIFLPNEVMILMDVSGFFMSEISVINNGSNLEVSGHLKLQFNDFLENQINVRNFKSEYVLEDNIKFKNYTISDGILKIRLDHQRR